MQVIEKKLTDKSIDPSVFSVPSFTSVSCSQMRKRNCFLLIGTISSVALLTELCSDDIKTLILNFKNII